VGGIILVLFALALTVHAQERSLSGKPWPRHAIDNTSKGADGVRLADLNSDGLLDVVTGWEEGGLIRVYLHPGRARVKAAWPQVTVGRVKSPEDAVPVDLDGDGAVDVVSACEGDTRAMFVHWAPKDKQKYMVSEAWTTDRLSSAPESQWMFALPMQIDGTNGVDLVIGSKGSNGKVGWLASPGNARNVGQWRFNELAKAGWIMTIASRDLDGDGDADVIYSDRKGEGSGVYWLENPGPHLARDGKPWAMHVIGALKREVMFLDLADMDADGQAEVVVAVKPDEVIVFRQGRSPREDWHAEHVKFDNLTVASAKAVTVADVDGDRRLDLIFTCEGAVGRRSGVVWAKLSVALPVRITDVYDIGGLDGVKFDLAPVVDLDGDGDLDVITTEEIENLGVVWYENPTH
jgi:VCBS repeat protein